MTQHANPIANLLNAYGANIDLIEEPTTIEVYPNGIRVQEFAEKPDGTLLVNEGIDPEIGSAVTVGKFYPHPTGRQVLYTHLDIIDEYTEKATAYLANGTVTETFYTNVAKKRRDIRGINIKVARGN